MIGGARKDAIVYYKADTSDLEKGTYKVTKEVETFGAKGKKAVASIGEAAKSVANGLDDVGRRTRNVTALFDAALNAVNANAARARAEYAAQGIAIDKVSASAGGLVERTHLLTFAAQAHHGAMKATDAQMQTAMVAMRQLTREGHDQSKVMDALTEAFVKADEGGLKQLGIAVRETNDPLDKQRAILEAVSLKASQLRDSSRTAAEEQTALGTKTADAFEKMKGAIGSLVGVLEPLISLLASAIEKTAGFIASAAKMAKESPEEFLGALALGGLGQWSGKQIAANGGIDDQLVSLSGPGALAQYRNFNKVNSSTGGAVPAGWDAQVQAQVLNAQILANLGQLANVANSNARRSTGGGGSGPSLVGYDTTFTSSSRGGLSSQTAGQAYGDYAGVQRTGAAFEQSSIMDRWMPKLEAQATAAKQQTFLEGHFGKLAEFDAYATAFTMLSGAVSASLGAWIDGSESASTAFRHFIADAIKGLAIQMSVEALKHGAYAIGNLAMGNVAGAALHGKAALGFGLGAAAAAVAARSLGTTAGDANRASSAGASGGAGAASGGGGRGGNGGSGDRTFVLVADDPDETQRMKSAKYRRMFEIGLGQIGYGSEAA